MTGKKLLIVVLALGFAAATQAVVTNPEGFNYTPRTLSANESAIGWTFGDTGTPIEPPETTSWSAEIISDGSSGNGMQIYGYGDGNGIVVFQPSPLA